MSRTKIIPELSGGDLMCRDGYLVRILDRNSSESWDKILLEIQTKDVEEYFTIYRTLDSLLKKLEKKEIELSYNSSEESVIK